MWETLNTQSEENVCHWDCLHSLALCCMRLHNTLYMYSKLPETRQMNAWSWQYLRLEELSIRSRLTQSSRLWCVGADRNGCRRDMAFTACELACKATLPACIRPRRQTFPHILLCWLSNRRIDIQEVECSSASEDKPESPSDPLGVICLRYSTWQITNAAIVRKTVESGHFTHIVGITASQAPDRFNFLNSQVQTLAFQISMRAPWADIYDQYVGERAEYAQTSTASYLGPAFSGCDFSLWCTKAVCIAKRRWWAHLGSTPCQFCMWFVFYTV